MLEIRDVRFAYPDRSFHFNLTVEAHNLTAIIGPSGGGKSTLLHLIAGFETPSSGDITFNAIPLQHLLPGERPVSIIFQDNNLFPHLTVLENVGLGFTPSLSLSADQKTQAAEALARVGLADSATKKPGELSGGERQRATIARTLLRKKPILLLDEAFTALGPALRRDMLHLIHDLHVEQRLTTLMVTHHPADAKAIASHVAFVVDGTVKAHGTTADIFAKSSHSEPYSDLERYLGEGPETV